MVKGSSAATLWGLPHLGGLRSDVEAMERNLFGGLNSLFEAAEEMKNGFFSVFDGESSSSSFSSSSSSSSSSGRRGRGISIEGGNPTNEASAEPFKAESGYDDLSGLAREV